MLDLKTGRVTDVPNSTHLFSPRWSPDGRCPLAMTPDTFKLKLYEFSTRAWQDFVMMGASYPSWSSDSKCVIFTASLTQRMLVYRACLANRKPQQIADLSVAGSQTRGSFGAMITITA